MLNLRPNCGRGLVRRPHWPSEKLAQYPITSTQVFKPEVIVHLAAKAGVRPSIDDPALYAEVNVTGTVHLLEAACAQAGPPLMLRRHAGYDHGYYFIATFMAEHLAHHARELRA